MKVIVVGDWISDIYEKAIYDGFMECGCETYKFNIHEFFCSRKTGKVSLNNRIKNKYSIGAIINDINNSFLNFCKKINPDIIFLNRVRHIKNSTLKVLKNNGVKIISYNNDNPFSEDYKNYFWRRYKYNLNYVDYIFVYRESNREYLFKKGFENVYVMKSYYIKEKNYVIDTIEKTIEVLFIGHFEQDGRDEYFKYLIDNGIALKLYCQGLENSRYYDFFKANSASFGPVYKEYNEVMNSAKIALVFLSKLNQDVYTRRCFEIPATKTFMLSQYTDFQNELFSEGSEAEYFRNKEELLDKINYYLKNDEFREQIASAGYDKVIRKGHTNIHRVSEVLDIIKEK